MSQILSASTPSALAFEQFGFHEKIVQTLTSIGYSQPTPIQTKTIPPLLLGKDVLGIAQTGTGKTAAFALPMLNRLDLHNPRVQVLVLTPTRELAIQVADAFEKYGQGLPGLKVATIYGGQDYQIQFRQLSRGAHVVVGTPGRITDHLRKGTLQLQGIQGMVLDEADEMLRMGFAEDVVTILDQLPADRQMALFSATMPDAIRSIAAKHLRSPVQIEVQRKAATADTVRQRYIISLPVHKQQTLQRVLEAEDTDGVLIFVKTRATCEPLAEYLQAAGHRTASLHGEVPQKQRERIIDQLRSGELDVIVATDVAARGLDVQRISHVFNYDLPFDHEAYVHRIGRTGRAGRSGIAILFVTPREQFKLRRLENSTGQKIEAMPLPANRDINKKRLAEFHSRIERALEHREAEAFQSIVEQFRRTHPDVSIEQVAAALGVMANQGEPLFDRQEWQAASFEAEGRFDRRGNGGGGGGGGRFDRRSGPDRGPRNRPQGRGGPSDFRNRRPSRVS